MKGEKLSKSQTKMLQDAREAHLSEQQRGLLRKARAEAAQTELERAKAERAYSLAVEEKGLHGAQAANSRLRAAKEQAQAASVRLAVVERTCGLRC